MPKRREEENLMDDNVGVEKKLHLDVHAVKDDLDKGESSQISECSEETDAREQIKSVQNEQTPKNNILFGYPNPGKLCFANVAVECLRNFDAVYAYFLSTDWSSSDQERKVSKALADLLRTTAFDPSVTTEKLRDLVAIDYSEFKKDKHHDSEEFLRALVNCIHEELRYENFFLIGNQGEVAADEWSRFMLTNDSIIGKYMIGMTTSLTVCEKCPIALRAYEKFTIMSLPLLSNHEEQLLSTLESYLSVQKLDQNWECSNCSCRGFGTVKSEFYRLPEILVFQFKRFVSVKEKIEAFIRFPLRLKLRSVTQSFVYYQLNSTINHSGILKKGHYTCFLKANEMWYEIDDTTVREVTEEDVETRDAYVLCYERCSQDSPHFEDLGVPLQREESFKLDGLSVAQMKELRESSEKHIFQAEVDRTMKLIINSLYKNKEIFLRELIANASDALDKTRFLSLTDKSALAATEDLSIKIKVDKENHVLHVTDTGVGMTKDELIKNLGTIAKSGTSDFLSKLGDASSQRETSDLIGQFGVGFYTSFLVADRVVVASKSNDDDQYIWDSDAASFSVTKDPRGNTLGRGTTVSLHLKEEDRGNLEQHKIKDLVKKCSQFINFPIYLWDSKVEIVEGRDEDEEKNTPKDVEKDEETMMEKEEDEVTEKPKTKEIEKTVWDWILINEHKPLWKKKLADVTDDEYNEFYESFSRDHEEPMAKTHFTAEGEVTFRSILYIPRTSPADMFQNYGKKVDSIKMFVRRVFITDNFEDMMPKYLSFVRGVVDSDDLPLNASHEVLQQHKLLKVIQEKLVEETLDMIQKISDGDYKTFWKEYSTNVKLGVMEDHSNRTRLAKLLRFFSSNSDTETTSLAKYLERMKEKQEHIYFVAGSSRMEVERSPFVERLLKKGYEILYLVEAVDEYCIQSLLEFEGKKFQNAAKEGLKLDESDKGKQRKEALEKEFDPLLTWMKDDALKEHIEKAVITECLTTSPCALVASSFGWSGNMERLEKAQRHQKTNDPSNQHYATQKKTLELNPRHPLVKELKNRVESNKDDQTTKDLALVLFETATLRSGFNLADTAAYAGRVERMLRLSMGVPLEEKVEGESEEDDE